MYNLWKKFIKNQQQSVLLHFYCLVNMKQILSHIVSLYDQCSCLY